MSDDATCPRCGHPLVEGTVRPGVSRWDDDTTVCAWCSEHEAMQQALDRAPDAAPDEPGPMTPRDLWWDVYDGEPVEDYRLVLLGRGTAGDKATVEIDLAMQRLRNR